MAAMVPVAARWHTLRRDPCPRHLVGRKRGPCRAQSGRRLRCPCAPCPSTTRGRLPRADQERRHRRQCPLRPSLPCLSLSDGGSASGDHSLDCVPAPSQRFDVCVQDVAHQVISFHDPAFSSCELHRSSAPFAIRPPRCANCSRLPLPLTLPPAHTASLAAQTTCPPPLAFSPSAPRSDWTSVSDPGEYLRESSLPPC